MRLNEKSLFFRRPALIVAAAVYLAAFILLLSGMFFYRYANELLECQRKDILDRTMEQTVREINNELQAISTTAQALRSALRYADMPPQDALDAEKRMQLHDYSSQMDKSLVDLSSVLQAGYLYARESGYAIFRFSVLSEAEMCRYYQTGGFSAAEMEELHCCFSQGRMVASQNGAQLAYLLSIGKDWDTGLPEKQIVLLLRKNFLSALLGGTEAVEAAYSLIDAQGNTLDEAMIGSFSEEAIEYSYQLKAGYTLKAAVPQTGWQEMAHARRNYLAAVAAGLLLVTVVAVLSCRFSVVPINQLIDYIEKNYKHVSRRDGLAAIQGAVDEMLEAQAAAQRQLEELRQARRWQQLIQRLHGGGGEEPVWQSRRFVLILLSPGATDQKAMLDAVRSLIREEEYAVLHLSEGTGLMLGGRDGEMDEKQGLRFAEALVALLDDQYSIPLKAAVSAGHAGLDELPAAHREARMTMDSLLPLPETLVMGYTSCDFKLGTLAQDGEYLARQQHFNRLIASGSLSRAAESLPELISDFYLQEDISRSEIGRMHLDMVKYQMMACLNYLYTGSEEALEMRRESIRELLLCATHGQVLALMEKRLREMADPRDDPAEEEGGDETLERVKRYIRLNYADPQMSVTSLAEVFHLSPNGLSKLFSRKAGVGVLQYIHKIRIEAACSLMLSTQLSLSDICQRVGYASPLTFSRAFKARYRMTPSEWRKMCEETGAGEG